MSCRALDIPKKFWLPCMLKFEGKTAHGLFTLYFSSRYINVSCYRNKSALLPDQTTTVLNRLVRWKQPQLDKQRNGKEGNP